MPALPTSITPAAGAAARRPVPRIVSASSPALDERAERLDGGERRVRVGGVEVAGDAHGVGGHRGQQRRAVRERLVRGRGDVPRSGPDGSKRRLIAPPPRAGRRRRRRSRRTARPVAAVREQAGPAVDGLLAPGRLAPAGGVDRVEPLQAERPLRAGRLLVAERGAQDAEAGDELVDRGDARRRGWRRGSPPTARRRRAPRASCRGTRCPASAACSPPSAASPASACAATCGTWLVRATAASCSSGVQATIRPPSASTAADSASSGSSASPAGQTAHGAPCEQHRDEAAQPAVSAPAIGCAADEPLVPAAARPSPRRCRRRARPAARRAPPPPPPRCGPAAPPPARARSPRRPASESATSKPSAAAAARTAGSAS